MTQPNCIDCNKNYIDCTCIKDDKNGIILRDNSISYDPRLDALHEHDERNFNYPVTTPSLVPINKYWLCLPALDQGKEGACTGFAFTQALRTEAHSYNIDSSIILDGNYAKNLYWEAQKIDNFPGGEYPGADPVKGGTSPLFALKVLKNAGIISGYTHGYSLMDLILGVGYNGPAVITIPWYKSMYECDAVSKFLEISGRISGYHAILVRAVNVEKEFFIMYNSWGTSYGDNGSVGISFDNMELLFKSLHEIIFTHTKEKK